MPEIAAREGWSVRYTVESLIRKAGYAGPITERLMASLAVTRYQSSPLTRSWADYEEDVAAARNAAAAKAAARGANGGG